MPSGLTAQEQEWWILHKTLGSPDNGGVLTMLRTISRERELRVKAADAATKLSDDLHKMRMERNALLFKRDEAQARAEKAEAQLAGKWIAVSTPPAFTRTWKDCGNEYQESDRVLINDRHWGVVTGNRAGSGWFDGVG